MAKYIVFIVIIVLILAGVGVFIFMSAPGANNEQNYWQCQNGGWVKVGEPTDPKPILACNGEPKPEADVIINTPQSNQVVISPLTIEGKARGGWFFEANAVLKLLDDKGQEIATSNVTATTDWMTNDLVEFKGQIRFISPANGTGTLVFANDNPSGLPENIKEFRIPVRFDNSQTMKVKAFFNNNNLDPEITCYKVFSVDREIPKTEAVARAALEELLAGPTFKEQSAGYSTSINPGVKIQKLEIVQGVVKVDFDETLEKAVGGSCRVTAIRSQISQTLEQFSTVEQVVISINGRVEDILQP